MPREIILLHSLFRRHAASAGFRLFDALENAEYLTPRAFIARNDIEADADDRL